MDLLYVDDKFTINQLNFFNTHGVTLPIKDNIYSLRDIVQCTQEGRGVGLLLVEIVNKPVPINHPLLGSVVNVEPNFSSKRFAHLNGLPILDAEIKEYIKEQVKKYEL